MFTKDRQLESINRRLTEIASEKPGRIFRLQQNRQGGDVDYLEEISIEELDTEKEELEIMRQAILDQRNGWKQRTLWSFLIPIIVSVITSILINQ